MLVKGVSRTLFFVKQAQCAFSTAAAKVDLKRQDRVNAWQVHSYGDISELQYGKVRIPQITEPDQLLINVEAASVNPIDLYMLGGYGRTLFQIPRKFEMELPLTLGRDFCGTVMYKGPTVGDSFSIGDKVYGFVPIHKQGSFSEVVLTSKEHICKKPENLTAQESASLVYASMTAYSALFYFGNLICEGAKNRKVLILGASGGVGTIAVQLLKSQGSIVHGTCSTDAVSLVQSLGADSVLDYKSSDCLKAVANEGYYDIILDCAQFGHENIPKNWKFGKYITLNSPLLLNTDKYGLLGGLLCSANTLFQANLKLPGQRKDVQWGFFVPSSSGFQFIHKLIVQGKIKPLIQNEFNIENLPDAFEELRKGHMRGKIVVTY